MAKRATTAKETDLSYFLKLVTYFVLGTIWLKYNGYVVFPAGAVLGAIIVHKDKYSVDRKIEFAVVLLAAVIGLTGWGLFIAI